MKISIVITVLNEQKTIEQLLHALGEQTKSADEIVIVDGGSSDQTVELIKKFKKMHQLPLTIIIEKGNRSEGRNKGIAVAKHPWIALTDAGCIPHPTWLAQLMKQAASKNERTVVAGYYDAKATTLFEKAVVPYVLVMPDRVNPKSFLPATRSMLLHRSLWQELGGFNEKVDVSEDYHFARKMLRAKPFIKIVFAEKAKVSWLPRKNLWSFMKMVFQMSRDDVRAGVMRIKAWAVLIRYLLALVIVYLTRFFTPFWGSMIILNCFFVYTLWAVFKNARYVGKAWLWLPVLQYAADVSVIAGSLFAVFSLPFWRSRVK